MNQARKNLFIAIGLWAVLANQGLAQSGGGPAAGAADPPADAGTVSGAATRPAGPTTALAASGPTSMPPPAGDEVALALNNAPVDQVARFLSEKRDKPVILAESVKGKTVTIVSTKKMPLAEALALVQEGLRQSGMVLEEYPNLINIKLLAEVKQTRLTVVPADQSVSKMPDKTKIVDKVFAIKHCDVLRAKDAIVPMLPTAGHVTADPNSRTLIVTDTVGNLERIEQILLALDVPGTGIPNTRIFQISKGDAREILPVLSVLISGSLGKRPKEAVTAAGMGAPSPAPTPSPGPGPSPAVMRGGPSGPPGGPSGPSGPPGPAAPAGAPTVVYVEEAKTPVVLMAETSRNWIIAVAQPDIMLKIEEWIAKLDQPSVVEQVFDIYPVEHADIEEVARQLKDSIEALPDVDVRQSIRIVPFLQSHKLLVFGTRRCRDLVKDLLEKLDVDTSEYQKYRVFVLKYADAEEVVKNIESLFSGLTVSYKSTYYTSYSADRSGAYARVKVTCDTRRNTVTVITDAVTMERIAQLVEKEWDLPVTTEDVKPRVFPLTHADPVQVKTMLENMFSRRERGGFSMYRYFFGYGDESETSGAAVGRLFGQFSFEAMPNSNKLVVSTKNPANYVVIEQLIKDLDQPQEAGLPKVIELRHANAEDLAEQLNSLLSEPGTLAEILRSQRELRPRDRGTVMSSGTAAPAPAQPAGGPQATPAGVMPFWWQRSRPRADEMPTSNLIGKIRFVPVNRRNALMVLAPQAHLAPIEKLVEELDRPGMQVMIHAVIAEVQHDDVTTLGLRIAADPAVLNDPRLTDTAIRGSGSAEGNQLFGGTFAIGGTTFGRVVLHGNLNVSALIQLLIKNYGMHVLFEPKLYTADNQESEFFDGRDVPILTETRTSAEGATTVSNVKYVPIGTSLRVRPHITEEGGVDLSINLELSRIVEGESILGNVVFDRRETTTHVIVQDGQTVMLGGIVRQEDFDEIRKVPLLGDIPWLGAIFRNVNKAKRSRELIAFITPIVVASPAQADQKMEPYLKSLRRVREEIGPVGRQNTVPGGSTTRPARGED